MKWVNLSGWVPGNRLKIWTPYIYIYYYGDVIVVDFGVDRIDGYDDDNADDDVVVDVGGVGVDLDDYDNNADIDACWTMVMMRITKKNMAMLMFSIMPSWIWEGQTIVMIYAVIMKLTLWFAL